MRSFYRIITQLFFGLLLLASCQQQNHAGTFNQSRAGKPFPQNEKTGWVDPTMVIEKVQAERVFWSPTENEFLYSTCPGWPDGHGPGEVYQVVLNSEQLGHHKVIEKIICPNFGMNISWSPNGEAFVFTGIDQEEAEYVEGLWDYHHIWIKKPTQNPEIVVHNGDSGTRGPSPQIWLDDQTFIYSGYNGGGHQGYALVSVDENGRSTLILTRCGFSEANLDFFVSCYGATENQGMSVFHLSTSQWRESFKKYDLAETEHPIFSSNIPEDNFIDKKNINSWPLAWSSKTNELLVRTWPSGMDREFDAPVPTRIMIFRVDLGSLLESGLPGNLLSARFSSNGKFLAYLIPEADHYTLLLIDRHNNELIMHKAEWVETYEGFEQISSRYEFSPDGRFLISFTPPGKEGEEGLLALFDIEHHQFVTNLPTQLERVIWSPDSTYFVYLTDQDEAALFALRKNQVVPITKYKGDRIFQYVRPQWSHDGRYLSVSNGKGETYILRVPVER